MSKRAKPPIRRDCVSLLTFRRQARRTCRDARPTAPSLRFSDAERGGPKKQNQFLTSHAAPSPRRRFPGRKEVRVSKMRTVYHGNYIDIQLYALDGLV
eukprot:3115419-Prymnesium_polylepis.2